MTWGCISLLIIAVLHLIACVDCSFRKQWPMAIAMFAFVVSDICFAYMAGVKNV